MNNLANLSLNSIQKTRPDLQLCSGTNVYNLFLFRKYPPKPRQLKVSPVIAAQTSSCASSDGSSAQEDNIPFTLSLIINLRIMRFWSDFTHNEICFLDFKIQQESSHLKMLIDKICFENLLTKCCSEPS